MVMCGEVESMPWWRRRRTIRLRTLMLAVFAVAVVFGYLEYRKRRAILDHLLDQARLGVAVTLEPLLPEQDPTLDRGGTIAAAVRVVREHRLERQAVSELTAALAEARGRRDEVSMIGTLVALKDMGPALADAGPEIVATVRMDGWSPRSQADGLMARRLAIHVLGKVTALDRSYAPALLAPAFEADPSPEGFLIACAARESIPYAATLPRARPQVLDALARSVARVRRPVEEVWDCGNISPHAWPRPRRIVPGPQRDSQGLIDLLAEFDASPDESATAVSFLKGIAHNAELPDDVRSSAVTASARLGLPRQARSDSREVGEFLDEFLRDDENRCTKDAALAVIDRLDRNERMLRREAELRQLIATNHADAAPLLPAPR